jgi:hypothetical protein
MNNFKLISKILHEDVAQAPTEIKYKLKGANLCLRMSSPTIKVPWEQDECPWNKAENTDKHECAILSGDVCPYYKGVEGFDNVLCAYPK